MKSSTLPPIRVEDDLRTAAENVLLDGETLSSFVESTVRRAVEHRQVKAEFEARAEAAWQHYRRTGISHSVDEVCDRLRAKVEARRKELLG